MSWKWLSSTKELQESFYGVDYRHLARDPELLADYMLTNAFSALDEIHEAAREIQWKPWAKNRGHVNREAMVEELVDVAHFIGNMLVALNVTDGEWAAAYQRKQAENVSRQLRGYEARNHETG